MIVDVDSVAHGGHCVARADGRVIFVRHALPGERVRIEITDRKKSFWRADAVEILRASPDRVTAPCRFAGVCGGCDLQHVSQAGQLNWKTQVLREQLVRLGGLAPETVAEVTVQPLAGGLLGWRTRMQYAVDRRGRAGLREQRSNAVVDIDRCLIADDRIQDTDVLKRNWSGSNVVGVVAGEDDQLSVYTQRDRRGKARYVAGPSRVTQLAAGHFFDLAADSFWQVHPLSAEAFAAKVADMLRPRDGEVVWDLYAGAGLFSAVLADAVGPAGRVLAVESDPAGDTARNLADIPGAEAVSQRVESAIATLPTPDIVVLDPPRSGAGVEVVDAIAAAGARAVCYVACDPAALSRDLRRFGEVGWNVEHIEAFDAFPMTQHFETIVLLTPVESGR
ncbi:23S rRNA m(5)U-1939 methyltransferase [Stackebrandtia endophytica]|uniref:23S rRNA m(5)U-1939 methyltransferase n=1 Tax=Stackebrandtia endophytica TaxID=1496996 RepID=A0A543B303_9ACTN|nr:TRAM domain-containing protein [Stackebrandtia endophytica]TQL79215.1 23S rRNA m(5)U-1939 methyltransferase [Stackebrandtia endophytica]